MKEVGRCPNCGAKLPKGKHGIIKCEYCDSEFADETPIMVIDDNLNDSYIKALKDFNGLKIACVGVTEMRINYINQCRELSNKYTSSSTRW